MLVEFNSARPEWKKLLDESDYDFYHLPAYLELECRDGEPVVFVYEREGSKAIIPLIKRNLNAENKEAYYDLVSPYGYAGILINKGFDYRNYNELINEFISACYEGKIVSAFIRLNPILNNVLFNESELIHQRIYGKTVYVDLKKSYSDIYNAYSGNHKRNIKKLQQNAFSIQLNNWDFYEEWQNVYIKTMKRLNASSYYLFDSYYFNSLRKILGTNLLLVTVHKEEHIAGGGIFTVYNGVIQYHLGGTSEEFLQEAPGKLMFDEIIKWGISNKCNLLHLGGGLGGNADSLFKFKQGFSKSTFQFSTLNCITNAVVYNQKVQSAFSKLENIDIASINYFPLYRYNGSFN